MTTWTYAKSYQAHTTNGGMATIPDEVYESQADFDGERITVLTRGGDPAPAVLRGDLYGLGTPGTGDPVVELIESD